MRSEDNLADLSERVVDIDSTLSIFFLIELKYGIKTKVLKFFRLDFSIFGIVALKIFGERILND